jgi:hypothetical protein
LQSNKGDTLWFFYKELQEDEMVIGQESPKRFILHRKKEGHQEEASQESCQHRVVVETF